MSEVTEDEEQNESLSRQEGKITFLFLYIHFLSTWAHLQRAITKKSVKDYGTMIDLLNWQWVCEFLIYTKLENTIY